MSAAKTFRQTQTEQALRTVTLLRTWLRLKCPRSGAIIRTQTFLTQSDLMSTATTSHEESRHTVSRRLAAEDIRAGSYITVIQQISEVVPFLWVSDMSPADREQPILYRHTPANSGEPHKVLAVCLPFVFVQDLRNNTHTFDLRRCEVTLLTDDYVEVVRKKQSPQLVLKCGKRKNGRKKKKSK